MRWFRFYSEALDDPKVQRLPGDLFKAWVNLLCLANDGTPRGTLPSIEDIGFRLRLTPAKTRAIVDDLVSRGLIDADGETLQPHNWSDRQAKSDNVAERVQKHRAKQQEAVTRNVTYPPDVTTQKKTRVDTETEIEEEGDKTNGSALPRVIVSDTPFAVYSAFLDETAAPDFKPAPEWKKKQIGIATRLLEQGYGDDKVRRCVRFMKSQTWRTSPFDLGGVEKYIGTWEAAGMPEIDQPKGSKRAKNEPDFSGIDTFTDAWKQAEARR